MTNDYPWRGVLNDELHSRPSIYFDAPAVVWHEAFFVGNEATHAPDTLLKLGLTNTSDGKSGIAQTTSGRIKWEIHAEFVSLTYVIQWSGDYNAIPLREEIWIKLVNEMPGQRINSIEIVVGLAGTHDAKLMLGAETDMDVAVSAIGNCDAEIWSTFRFNEANATRFVLLNNNLNAFRTGRMVRRLLEIEDYRLMALISLPLAQDTFSRCSVFETRLQTIVDALGKQAHQQERLLKDLAQLASEILDVSVNTGERFSATAAYSELVFARLAELREQHVDGYQRLGVFIERRFRPAIRFCAQASKRIENSATRVSRASDLLRTSVQVELEQQNLQLLESMEKRVQVQTKLQEAVEGFSIVAISYYAIGLYKTLLESLGHVEAISGMKTFLTLAGFPVIILAVWYLVHRARKLVHF
ncbi:hypothetical protein Brsp07_05203 [Brucella sp. NBRC 14130]|uniref:DUF3422 domain-containing protein n=1 Tax=Brucella TaxID=234 RepID=UPI00159C6CF0|nr:MULTISPECIES: DUF3422 domain-containing protein [Brucella/Ochrobactrum group]NVM42318.1 DUF3422 domain-containing protein [Brucella intermedia]